MYGTLMKMKPIIIVSAIAIALGAETALYNHNQRQVNFISLPSNDTILPPRRYRADSTVTVRFVSDVVSECQALGLNGRSTQPDACAVISSSKKELVIPNPCGQSGAYARLLCHELGHANGWRH